MVAENPPQTDEGRQLVSEITKAEQQVKVRNSSETYNIAQDLDDGLSREIGQEIKRGYQSDEDSRSEWLDMHTFWMRLYNQMDYADNSSTERDWGATESIPILTESCNQFQSRTYKSFFPSDTFVSAIALKHTNDPIQKKLLKERAERIARHMSWQLGVQNKNYKRDKDSLFLGVAVHGSFFTKTYFDAYKKRRPCIDNIRPTDLVINYNNGPIHIEDVRRKSHIINTSVGDTMRLAKQRWFLQEARSSQDSNMSQYDNAVNDISGVSYGASISRKDAPAKLVEQHFYLDLNDDGNYLPYIGTIDTVTGNLLRLTIGWEADSMGNPLKDYDQTQYFTHYKFMENPDGFYGYGLGHLLGDLNSGINIATRQVLDAATLQNDGNNSGFISERIALDQGDEMVMTLGKFRKVSATVDDINKAVMTMKFPGPSDTLIKLIEYMDARAQRLGSTTEATTGAPESSRQPTTYLAEVEQAMEIFSSVQMRISESVTDELSKIYNINRKYLPLVEYYSINNETGAVTRSDYADDMIIRPIFDPKFSTRAQKVAKAKAELDATLQNPLSQTRPQVFDIAFRRYLEALECDNIDELLPPTPIEQIVNAQQQFQRQAAIAQPDTAATMATGQTNEMGNAASQAIVPAETGQPGTGNAAPGTPAGGAATGY